MSDIEDAEKRLARFAPYIKKAFPETESTDGVIESPLVEISRMKTVSYTHLDVYKRQTITVRKAAGAGLLSIIGKMPLEQRNELTVELFNGLEIGDYQFSKRCV